ncbi:hypothetical protein JTE90_005731 [Oedothorax gibbosus]|uniref:BED-type domain-containing protein n=1 Tax=Oedothorax gibbosus TaxID=931172 RepID=A0AAV6U030_9ARAC|nr:hypothetical protein JTE90_005731 [Oedothorax gibbosus]
MKKGASLVWKYFVKGDNNEAQCSLCLKKLKTGGGTTNLRQHLKQKHPNYAAEEGASKTDEIEDENASAVEPILIQRSKRKRRIPEDSAVDVTILPRITSIESNGIRPSERFSRAKDFDEFDVFGQMVATQIRKFSRRNQAVAKNTIQNFLFDMEMREMDETPAPVQETVLQSLDPSSPPQITKHANTAEIDGIQQDM